MGTSSNSGGGASSQIKYMGGVAHQAAQFWIYNLRPPEHLQHQIPCHPAHYHQYPHHPLPLLWHLLLYLWLTQDHLAIVFHLSLYRCLPNKVHWTPIWHTRVRYIRVFSWRGFDHLQPRTWCSEPYTLLVFRLRARGLKTWVEFLSIYQLGQIWTNQGYICLLIVWHIDICSITTALELDKNMNFQKALSTYSTQWRTFEPSMTWCCY